MRWTGLLLLVVVVVEPSEVPSTASCALRTPADSGLQRLEVSDGQELLIATWAPRRSEPECRITLRPSEVQHFWGRCRLVRGQQHQQHFLPSLEEAKSVCRRNIHGPPRRAKRGFTYPGTLWCGAGNIAETYDQLGAHWETDRCCREHDHCQHVIHPFTYKYGYRNFRWHTISHCDCDNRLKTCLRAVNDTASRVVGQAFFNIIQVPCFEFTYMEQCVEPYLYVWCKNYSTVAVAVTQDPVLYDYGGLLIDGPVVHQPPNRTSSSTSAPDSQSWPMATSRTPALKPGQAAPEVITSSAPKEKPRNKHRKGKGKRRGKKKGKNLKKKNKKAEQNVGGAALQYPGEEEAIPPPKHRDVPELGKMDLQSPIGLPDQKDEDPFNAILGDDPASLQFGEPMVQTENKTPDPQKEAVSPSPAQTFRGKRKQERKGRRTVRQKEQSHLS